MGGLNLYQKLAKIREITSVVAKNKSGYNYKYTDLTEILARVSVGMKKYEVSLIPSVVPGTQTVTQNVIRNTKFDKTGKSYEAVTTEMLFSAEMIYTWVNDENPDDRISVPWFIVGAQSDPSQAAGSGASYALRYFLLNYFQIATPETDVDAYRSKQKAAEASEDVAIAENIIATFDKKIKDYLAENPDKNEELKEFCKRHIKKSANYLAVKDPATASKLLQEFTNTYLGGKEE